jgi:hypothetical protein
MSWALEAGCGSLEFCNSLIGEGGSEPMIVPQAMIMNKAETIKG